eukprot:gnl/TRDRNA2_/TRDRNA2_175600_c2_seq10.p1 gnl/TRDRNA2_/TRDRNA2_175600_c2~~gnl/TRDRNA2_/TRDRNA2_175600_c2_seq10.p1  ORF type:complete len:188 (-),score=36.51 gnl/TRDRNA2_/TRDRNA2_175600_c2_seq10:294-857(-)
MGAAACKTVCKACSPCYNNDSDDAVPGGETIQQSIDLEEAAEEEKELGEALENLLSHEFIITIDRSQGGILGVEVDDDVDGELLIIDKVQLSGLIPQWNAKTSEANTVRAGQCIVQINNVMGNSEALMSECCNDKLLKMRISKAEEDDFIRRNISGSDSPRKIVSAVSVSTSEKFARLEAWQRECGA